MLPTTQWHSLLHGTSDHNHITGSQLPVFDKPVDNDNANPSLNTPDTLGNKGLGTTKGVGMHVRKKRNVD